MIRHAVAYFNKESLPTTEAWFALLNEKSKFGVFPNVEMNFLTFTGNIEFFYKKKLLKYQYTPSTLFEDESKKFQIKSSQYDTKIIIRAKNINSFYCAFGSLGYLMQLCGGSVFNSETDVFYTGEAAVDYARWQLT